MFQDISGQTVSIPSCWKREKSIVDDGTQTSEVLTYDTSSQSHDTSDVAIQTEPEEEKQQPNKFIVDNSAELREFLKKVEPMVSAALKRNIKSHAFDGYKVQWEEESTSVTTIHTLSYPSYAEFQCTDISWNSTGSVIAVSYGKFDHDDWCTHKSVVCTWNLDRRSLEPQKPDVTIELPTCIMCTVFHPTLPSILAVGTFTGEIRLFNTGWEGDPLIAQSGFTELSHKEPIAQLSWLPDSDRKGKTHLLSLGNDGKLLIWEWTHEETTRQNFGKVSQLHLLKGFCLKSSSIPQNIRVAKANIKSELGGTCFSFSCEDKSVFVVGCENGSLVKCSLDSSSDISLLTDESELPSPVKYAFRPHHGPVYGVSCSPFHRNLFLSCGIDTVTRLSTLLESAPLLLIEPGKGYLFSVVWSPTRPTVIALGTAQGNVLMYDLQFSHIKPKLLIPVCDKKPVYCLQYNPHRPRVLATGDGNGTVKILRLSTELTQQTKEEIDYLNSLASDSIDTTI